jgi:hypothetical protein
MAGSSKTFAQDHAERIAWQTQRDIEDYKRCLPSNDHAYGRTGTCSFDPWILSNQFLDGDFEMDEVLCRPLARGLLSDGRVKPTPLLPEPAVAPNPAARTWLEEYLLGEPAGQVGSLDRTVGEFTNAAAGPGNAAANANALRKAVNASVGTRTTGAVLAAMRTIESGATGNIRINQYMTLYNANNKAKRGPIPRMRVVGLPTQVVMPALGLGAQEWRGGIRAGMAGQEGALRATQAGKLTSNAHWSSGGRFLNSGWGGGVLTFAPSAAIDLYNSVDRDMSGNRTMNWKKFAIASVKSQSGNLLGVGAGAAAIAIVGVSIAGAPLILVGLGAGIFAQWVWGASGGSDWAASHAERRLQR